MSSYSAVMPNAPEPDRQRHARLAWVRPQEPGAIRVASAAEPGEEETEGYPLVPDDAETETVVINKPEPDGDPEPNPEGQQRERRFTAPGFDAKETAIIATPPEPATEVFAIAAAAGPSARRRSWHATESRCATIDPARDGEDYGRQGNSTGAGCLALVVVVLALAAIAILGTVLLTRSKHLKVSQEDQVRHTIQEFDIAVQRGDLTALRSITCGTTRDGYVDYDEHAWAETYQRVSAAKQYPVIASIDQVVVNGQHAEANVTTFMAYDPQVRSTRSLDLQYRDDQWKICQSPSG